MVCNWDIMLKVIRYIYELLIWGHFFIMKIVWFCRQLTILHYFINKLFILMLYYKNVGIMNSWFELYIRSENSTTGMCVYNYLLLTTLPASLLCKFIMYRKSLPFSKTSTNFRENLWPNLALSLHPPHSQSFPLGCFRL